jgi:hypothetical protein
MLTYIQNVISKQTSLRLFPDMKKNNKYNEKICKILYFEEVCYQLYKKFNYYPSHQLKDSNSKELRNIIKAGIASELSNYFKKGTSNEKF